MKAKLTRLKQRDLDVQEDRYNEILKFDTDNVYPTRMIMLTNGSSRAKSCVKMYSRFLSGGGFIDKNFYAAKVNYRGMTGDQLLRKTAEQKALHRGFAWHINYNANYKITQVTPVDFDHCRLGIPDDNGVVSKIALHPDWAKLRKAKSFKRDDIKFIDVFNPDPAAINAQVTLAGGWANYKGQLLWHSDDGMWKYPLNAIDSVQEDVDSDRRTSNYKNSQIRNNFMASHMLVTESAAEDDKSSEEFDNTLRDFQGDEEAGKIFKVELQSGEKDPRLMALTSNVNDKLYQFTEESVKDKIRSPFMLPPVLLGDLIAGKMGTAQEIQDATNFTNGITYPDRLDIEETFLKVFSLSADAVIAAVTDFTINTLKMIDTKTAVLAEVLGVGGTQALTAILQDPNLQAGQKINAIILLFGIDSDKATALVNGTPLPQIAA